MVCESDDNIESKYKFGFAVLFANTYAMRGFQVECHVRVAMLAQIE